MADSKKNLLRELLAGLLFLTVGLVFGVSALSYKMGDIEHMGPGFFPLLLSGLLITIASIMIVRCLVWKS